MILDEEGKEKSSTHSHSVHEKSRDESVDVLLERRLSSSLDLVDHLLHRESEEREGCLEDIEDLVDELPRLSRSR